MWTEENRQRYNRDKLRYPSDLTEDEWSVLEPLIPPAKRGGRKRTVEMREVVNGAMYVLIPVRDKIDSRGGVPPSDICGSLSQYGDLHGGSGTWERR